MKELKFDALTDYDRCFCNGLKEHAERWPECIKEAVPERRFPPGSWKPCECGHRKYQHRTEDYSEWAGCWRCLCREYAEGVLMELPTKEEYTLACPDCGYRPSITSEDDLWAAVYHVQNCPLRPSWAKVIANRIKDFGLRRQV